MPAGGASLLILARPHIYYLNSLNKPRLIFKLWTWVFRLEPSNSRWFFESTLWSVVSNVFIYFYVFNYSYLDFGINPQTGWWNLGQGEGGNEPVDRALKTLNYVCFQPKYIASVQGSEFRGKKCKIFHVFNFMLTILYNVKFLKYTRLFICHNIEQA